MVQKQGAKPTYRDAPKLAHHRLQRLLILLQKRIQLLVLMLQLLILGDEVRRERFELRCELLCIRQPSRSSSKLEIRDRLGSPGFKLGSRIR